MKSLCTLAAIALPLAAIAQTPAPAARPLRPSTLAIDVRNVSASSKTGDTFRDGYGSHDIKTSKERKIHVQLEAIGETDITAHVTVYWIGKITASNFRRTLKVTESDHKIGPAKPDGFADSSGEIEGHDLNLPLANYRSTGGYRLEGWVVHVTADNVDRWLSSDSFLIDEVRKDSAEKENQAIRALQKKW